MSQSSLHQAAVILKSLPKKQAAKILSRLEAEDIKAIFDALDKVDGFSTAEIRMALNKLAAETGQSQFHGEDRELGQFSDQLKTISPALPKISESSYRPFAFIVDLTPEIRQKLVQDEHPKNIAMVLGDLSPEISAEIIGQLEPAIRVSVLRRLCDPASNTQEERAQLSYALKLRLKKLVNKNQYRKSGVEIVADLLSCADPDTQREVFAHLSQKDPELAEKIEQSVFVFSDIESMSDAEIKILLRRADTSIWAPALKRSSLATRTKILSNMAERAAKLLSEEISTIGLVDEHIADRAQQQIVNLILRIRRAEQTGQEPKLPSIDSRTNSPYYIRT